MKSSKCRKGGIRACKRRYQALRWYGGRVKTVIHFYADSVNGDDGNDGLTEETAFQTLGALETAALAYGDGVSVALAKGSTWRESLNLNNTKKVSVQVYGSGSIPVVTGLDIVSSWTQDPTYTNTWYADVSHDGTSTNRQIAIEDDAMLVRVADVATLDGQPGAYYCAQASTANPTRVWVHPTGSTNPNINGSVYEVTARPQTIRLGDNPTMADIICKAAISNNGPLDLIDLENVTVRRAAGVFGTKHMGGMGSGLAEDIVLFGQDAIIPSELSNVPWVAYLIDGTGMTATNRRVFAYVEPSSAGAGFYNHDSLGNAPDSIYYDQCVLRDGPNGGSFGYGGGGILVNLLNSAGINRFGAPISIGGRTVNITRLIGRCGFDKINQVGKLAGDANNTATVRQTALARPVSGGSNPFYRVLSATTVTLENCSLIVDSGVFAYVVLLQSSTANLTMNRCILQGNNVLDIPAGATYTGDYNVFVRSGAAPIARFNGTTYNLITNMAGWRAATGQDANSIALQVAVTTGVLADGDFSVDYSTITGAGHDGNAGVTEYWDYNTRSVVSGQPTAWPTIPTNLAEAKTYIADPEGWDFYP